MALKIKIFGLSNEFGIGAINIPERSELDK